ncbi:superoxide dismutase [Pseudaquabacterium rugosum]|uniref:Superoxide dismutase n=1 Tax=Pseudaquabacterium rugosum TaxID=2984194 RepID=A0ABU9BGX6_9BURK
MPHVLPALPWPTSALEPCIDTATMEIHHGRHHQTYVDGLNKALAGSGLEDLPVEALLRRWDDLPATLQGAVRNHGGGHANHSLFWQTMTPGGGTPDAELAASLTRDLGGIEGFRTRWTEAALSRFGSGWAWLCLKPDGHLVIESSANQDSPLMHGHQPLAGLDVWEHAYYLKYQNRRAEYVAAFFQVMDWAAVGQRWRAAVHALG